MGFGVEVGNTEGRGDCRMQPLVHLASRYRWELMLFIGIPLVEQASWWLLTHALGNFNITFDVDSLPSYIAPFLNLSLVLLCLLYFRVRRLGRSTLSLLWTFAFVYEAVATTTYLVFDVTDSERWSVVSTSWWSIGVAFLLSTLVLVWFARQASRISFNHALVLIGLAFALDGSGLLMPNLIRAGFEGGQVAWDIVFIVLALNLFAVWVLSRLDVPRESHEMDIERWIGRWDIPTFGVPLRRLAVRVLPRFDPARGISKELVLALFGLNWLLHIYMTLWSLIVQDHETALIFVFSVPGVMFWPLYIAIVIVLAYAVRVRESPERPFTGCRGRGSR